MTALADITCLHYSIDSIIICNWQI